MRTRWSDLARALQNKWKNKNIKLIQFRSGDWVLHSTQPTRKHELPSCWIEHFRVTKAVTRNVYKVEELTRKTRKVHASRLWFYNTSNPDPEIYVEKIFRQHWHWSGLDLDSVVDIEQDNNGNVTVLVQWYGFSEDDLTELTSAQMLDGRHLMLDKCLEVHITQNCKMLLRNEYELIRKNLRMPRRLHGANLLEHLLHFSVERSFLGISIVQQGRKLTSQAVFPWHPLHLLSLL